MKKSIRKKIAFTFIVIMVLVLAAVGAFQWFFAGSFYASQKQKKLVESYARIADQGDGTDWDAFNNYCSVNGLTYCVTDSQMNATHTNAQNDDAMAGRLFGFIMGMEDDHAQIIQSSGSYTIIQLKDRFTKMQYLELYAGMEDGGYYMVMCPVQSISDAAQVSTRFFIYISIVAVIAGAIAMWLITRKIVQPIQELTALSKRMADLDFDARYTSGGQDEIGELGENFNQMSDNLEHAVEDLKTANTKLQKDIEQKTQIDDMRKEFLSNVSHELKTPIALIQGYAEGLKDCINDDPESRDFYCDVIIDESGKMNTMVKQLLTLNQLEFGNDLVSMARFNLTELINGVIQSAKVMIQQAQVRVEFDQEDPVWVWGDEFKIEEVVTNYLTNAIHHAEGEKIISIHCREQNGIVTTCVFNTGSPIPEGSLDKIWIKFYKVDKARTRAYGGSGIGLSIVKAIMDGHHQKCWAENQEDGVAFYFTLESKVEL
ncbi:MAG: HAMP domain-containing histidine kinase [Eubacterium sp.]|nr:HAMP domain-containing histidine kinase [Eubacterium sp.]